MEINKNLQKVTGIYKIKVIGNKRIYEYIGSSLNTYQRIHDHKSRLKNKKHSNIILQNLFNKYGEKRFNVELVEICNKEKLTEREQFWINKINPYINITKEVIRNTPSKESIIKIKNTLIKRKKNGEIPHSGTDMKEVYSYNIEGEFLKKFDSISEAARYYKTAPGNIGRVCNGERKSYSGFQFKFKGDYPLKINKETKNRIKSKKYNINVNGLNIEGGIHGLYKFLSDNLYENPNIEYNIRLAPVKSSELLENLDTDNQQPSTLEIK